MSCISPDPHESGHLHVTGAARYVADEPGPHGTVFVLPVPSPVARGVIENLDVSPALAVPGVLAALTVNEIPGDNILGSHPTQTPSR